MGIIAQMWRLSGSEKPGRDEASVCGADFMVETCKCIDPKQGLAVGGAIDVGPITLLAIRPDYHLRHIWPHFPAIGQFRIHIHSETIPTSLRQNGSRTEQMLPVSTIAVVSVRRIPSPGPA